MSGSRRVKKFLIPAFLIVILAVSMLAVYLSQSSGSQTKADPNAYVGIAFGGNTTDQAEVLIDKVKGYTNLFILDSGRNPISANQTKVEEICDYAVARNLSVIINLGIKDAGNSSSWGWFWNQPSLDSIKQRWTERWGNKFLGIYYNDEPGGIQLDASWRRFYEYVGENLSKVDFPAAQSLEDIRLKLLNYINNGTKPSPDDYDLEANFFIQQVIMRDPGIENLTYSGITSFTSDYGLYWWDYMGGYNVMFAELGWNVSVAEQIALVKGAARLQDKEWGTMITWKYPNPPYLDSGDKIYNQMLASYQAGAKYIAVFNYPYDGGAYGTLTDEHFVALQKFWNTITTKEPVDLSSPLAALVLPKNFGWGLRNPNDTIWGFWTTDNRTAQTALVTSRLVSYYGIRLDIVYDDPLFPVEHANYQHIYYWNSTTP
ncbi:MAG: hypothetical protein M1167_05870 [Chloroflexi bacterium]|nr:hypothetical protein [Chloroflexota bacterium]MCL5949856.1 hypothetical protein [Candidatus Bathyarchaeota archaeon]